MIVKYIYRRRLNNYDNTELFHILVFIFVLTYPAIPRYII